ncbi:MarR family transcriptional regulator [Solirubrobacter sp. CPCC 204708]|uniref:MarR family transcriptional regulator n=1 Tax=Solirubrobacter deserti TaxID=2282478 RepID=A0ABT4RFM6_9ACTN|nr:MarR family transcriptional regulator [Solirubrobacter deserti]MBE2318070.1 MarR family transcriptional regulator [Solirubrobacter deserti]MDA0137348.1 MarR family transcriptional regulator [Solirubrobacter deserti]
MHAQEDRTANLLGALALEVAHAQQEAVNAVVGQSGAAAAAIVVIAARPGLTLEYLRGPLGLSQPGATRLVERLVAAGWVERSGPGGRRGLELRLAPAGEAIFDELLLARRAAVNSVLAPLDAEQQDQLSALLETLLAARVGGRADLERVCRLCERRVCGRCPVGGAMDRLLQSE